MWTHHPFTEAARSAKTVRDRLASPDIAFVPKLPSGQHQPVDLGLFTLELSTPVIVAGLDGDDVYLGVSADSGIFIEPVQFDALYNPTVPASKTVDALRARLVARPRIRLNSEDRALIAAMTISESDLRSEARSRRGADVHANAGMGWFEDDRLSALYGCSGGHFSTLYIYSARSQVAAFINIGSPSSELRLQLAREVVGSFAVPSASTAWSPAEIDQVWETTLERFAADD